MKFLCERCKTKYSIGDDRVRGKILKIRCKNCSNIVTVRDEEAVGARAGGAAKEGSPQLNKALDRALMQPQAGRAAAVASPPPPDEAWYIAVGQQQLGPLPFQEIVKKIDQGLATADSYVWREGLDDWVRAESVPELRPHLRKRKVTSPPIPAAALKTEPRTTSPAAGARRDEKGSGIVGARASGAGSGAMPVLAGPRPAAPLGGAASKPSLAMAAAPVAVPSSGDGDEASLEFNIAEPSRIVRLDALFAAGKTGATASQPPAGQVFTLPGMAGEPPADDQTVAEVAPPQPEPGNLPLFAPNATPESRAVNHYRLLSVVLGTMVLGLLVVSAALWSRSMNAKTVIIEKEKSPEDVGAEIADQLVREAARKKLETSGLAAEPDLVPAARTPPPRRATRSGPGHKDSRPTIAQAGGKPADRLGELYSDTSKGGMDLRGPDRPQDDAVGMFKRGAKLCYERALKKDPSMASATKIDVNVTTASNGAVSSIDISQPYRSQFLGQCLSVMIRKLPWPAEGRVWQFPLVFRGS